MAMLRGQHATEVAGGVLFRMEANIFFSFFLTVKLPFEITSVQIRSICAGTECRRSVLRLLKMIP